MDGTTESIFADYWTEAELAAQLNRTKRQIRNWRAMRIGPPVTKIGNSNFYRKAAVREWIVSREQPQVRAGAR